MGRKTFEDKNSKIRVGAEAVVVILLTIGDEAHPGVETAREDRWAR